MALLTAVGLLFQALSFFVDLYFVANLGDEAVAGVSAAGNAMFMVLAFTQALGVGTLALISHAVGRKDQQKSNLIFNQALLIAAVGAVLSLIAGYVLAVPYLRAVSAQEVIVRQGSNYLFWFLPSLALQFPLAVMGAALRGIGSITPVIIVQVITVLLKTTLAPILIAGWGTEHAMGVAGAGLASSIAVLSGLLLLAVHFNQRERDIYFCTEQCRPQLAVWRRILSVGWPAGGELLLFFFYTSFTFWAISSFGSAAQAGFGIGSRIMQLISLPTMAIAFGVAPIAGQNVGAHQLNRVRDTIRVGSMQTIGITLLAMLLCQWQPEAMVRLFSTEPDVVHVGAAFLQVISWSFVLSAVSLVCAGAFQALGNTLPALLSSFTRLVMYCAPMIWLTSQPGYRLEHVWLLSIAATILQTVLNIFFLRKELRLRLRPSIENRPS